jgi:FKBP-type peptidyl-prolyl cis-trans isomerase SlyD
MRVSRHSVVRFEYTLHIAGKEVAHETRTILIGHAYDLPPGLEELLLEGTAGESLDVVVPAAQAYGLYDSAKVVEASRDDFPAGTELKVGAQFYSEDEAAKAVAYRIAGIEGDAITLDANPEHAGQDLHYQINIHQVRAAEPGELEHGHVHGEGGVRH